MGMQKRQQNERRQATGQPREGIRAAGRGATQLCRKHFRWIRNAFRGPIKYLALTGPERGSDELVWLASSRPGTDWKSCEYYAHHKIAEANPRAYDPVLARELWEYSLEMVAV